MTWEKVVDRDMKIRGLDGLKVVVVVDITRIAKWHNWFKIIGFNAATMER